ncbi:C-type mannose receptor 2 [Aplysia californica]|uniref:C-type mannose receptor 2 n=1 Tax=Aplysia californica TaxID=6500 RepID=A0ABM0JK54_APLCA|nr:C-type mannose receptor 2 [Aplysia californica]
MGKTTLSLLPFLALAVVLCSDSVAADTPFQCRSGWVSAMGSCYLFNNNRRLSFDRAVDFCDGQNFGSKLLTIQSDQEKQWINAQFSKYPDVEMWWTSYKGIDYDGNILTAEDEPNGLTNLTIVTEPDDTNHTQNCVEIDHLGFFEDEDCSSLRRPICEVEKQSNTSECPTLARFLPMPFGTSCYYYSISYSTRLTWQNALAKCQEVSIGTNKGHLLSIRGRREREFVQNTLMSRLRYRSDKYWTGLNDKQTEGYYVYEDGTRASSYSIPWMSSRNLVSNKDICFRLVQGSKVYPTSCNEQKYGLICREKAVPMPETQCPNYWLRAADSCYYPSYDQKNWQDASKFCSDQGAHLLKTDSDDELRWLDTVNMWSRPNYHVGYWTGLNNIQTKQTYVWQDKSEPSKGYVAWARTYSATGNYRCTAFYPGKDYTRFVSCDRRYSSGCQYVKPSGGKCSTGWTEKFNKCYKVVKDTSTFDVSLVPCYQDVGSQNPNSRIQVDYLTVENAAELTFINGLATNAGVYSLYLGLNDQDVYGEFRWGWSNTPVNMTLLNFDTEPSHQDTQNCVYILEGGFSKTGMCDIEKNYICEKEKKWIPGTASTN